MHQTTKPSYILLFILIPVLISCNKNHQAAQKITATDTSIAKQLEGDYEETITKRLTYQYPYQPQDSIFSRQITLKKDTDTSLFMFGSYIADSMLIRIPAPGNSIFVADSNNRAIIVSTGLNAAGDMFSGQITPGNTRLNYVYHANAWPALITLYVHLEKN